tara:strand:- start:3901 stop:4053 length:153 start_codon:yes stop_codon:yes gene_type:complete
MTEEGDKYLIWLLGQGSHSILKGDPQCGETPNKPRAKKQIEHKTRSGYVE